jgi:hypothetical protein
MKVRVDDCRERRDGQWIVFFKVAPGGLKATALSPVRVEIGRDCVVRDGRVVKP